MTDANDKAVFFTVDGLFATITASTTAVVGLIVTAGAAAIHWPWPPFVVATVVATAIAAGHRHRLTISPAGIELCALGAWIVPTRRQRWLLDADIDLYESWEASAPEGICIASRRGPRRDESECFGTGSEGAVRALHAAASAALARVRSQVPAAPGDLRHPLLSSQRDAFDVARAHRAPNGRLRVIENLAPVRLGTLVIPIGSQFRLNDDGFIDPRREDWLENIEVAGPVVVHGWTTIAGAVLTFDDDGAGPISSARAAFAGDLEWQRKPVRGDAPIGFAPDGALRSFTLGRTTTLGGFPFPAGSSFHYSAGWKRWLPAAWSCHLGGALALPETTLEKEESCRLSEDFARLTTISPRLELVLPIGRVKAGILPIPVTPDGRVDLEACRKKGLVQGLVKVS